MQEQKLTNEKTLYLLAFVLALAMRLVNLGDMPLSDQEAEWAVQAFQLTQGETDVIGPQPAYVLITTFLFDLFGSSETIARLLPALIGGMVVLVPFQLRDVIGRKAALILTLSLAFDPGLVALSRQAGSPMLAVGFSLATFLAWYSGSWTLAGILGALALLSGPVIVMGMLGIVTTAILVRVLRLSRGIQFYKIRNMMASSSFRQSVIAAAITVLVAGTYFLRFPRGFSAFVSILPEFITGWTAVPQVPIIHIPVALIIYQPLAVAFGLIGLVRAWVEDNQTGRILSLWLVIAIGLAIVYPARQVDDLAWALLPLLALTAIEISRHLDWQPKDGVVAWGHSLFVLTFLTFLYFNIAAMATLDTTTAAFTNRLIAAGSVFVVILVATVLIGLGWSMKAATRGLVWGLLASLGLYVFSVSSNFTYSPNSQRVANELWYPTPAAGQERLMISTLGDVSEFELGDRSGVEVVYQIDTPAVRWALRRFPRARYSSQIGISDSPAAIITNQNVGDPSLIAGYRGQSFAWRVYPNWESVLPLNFLRWWLFREASTWSENIILWARTDLFPGDVQLDAAGPGVIP